MELTDTAIARLTREAKEKGELIEQRDSRCPGLELRVGKTGSRTWALRCRDGVRRLRTLTVGHYPEMGLAQARDEARRMRVALAAGTDPKPKPAAEPAAAVAGITLEKVIALYEEKRGVDLKSWAHSRKRVDRVFDSVLKRPIAELKASQLQTLAEDYHAKQSAAFAIRTLRPVLKWAAKRGIVPKKLYKIEEPIAVNKRYRVLTPKELAAVLTVLLAEERPHTDLFLFLLLTLARRDEAAAARWRDVDFERKIWRIAETKNGEPHEVPLSRQAMALLDKLGPGAPEALIFATASGRPLGNWDRETKRVHRASETTGWHRHDLRRTSATMLGEMGELPAIIEAALNHIHIHSPLAATYNRSRYRPQVAQALQRLADRYEAIVNGVKVV